MKTLTVNSGIKNLRKLLLPDFGFKHFFNGLWDKPGNVSAQRNDFFYNA